jgi:hypothetical protein
MAARWGIFPSQASLWPRCGSKWWPTSSAPWMILRQGRGDPCGRPTRQAQDLPLLGMRGKEVMCNYRRREAGRQPPMDC